MFKLFCGNIHLEESLCPHIVQGCFILVQNNTANSARAGKATDYLVSFWEAADGVGRGAFSRNSHNTSIIDSCIDGSIFGEGKILGADEMG